MHFVDNHTHLHFPEFQGDFDQVVERARAAGVRYFINAGTNLESSRQVIELSEKYNFMYAAVGIHPHDVKDVTEENIALLAAYARHSKVIAIGEIGLDFNKDISPQAVQREVLVKLFNVAKIVNLPLILHIRDAYDEMIELLQQHFEPPIHAVSHCFSGTREVMGKLLSLGLYISFAGQITYKKNDELCEAVKQCPEDRILIETDAPFLAPQVHRGERNEPAFLADTAKWIADLKGISLERLAKITSLNAERFYGISFYTSSLEQDDK
jgi:TatD DNase family protein